MGYNLENKIKKDFSRLGWALIISNIFSYFILYIYMKSIIYLYYKDSLNVVFDINKLNSNQIYIGSILIALFKYFVLHIYNARDGIKTIDLLKSKGISIKNILKIFIIAYFFVMIGSYTTLIIELILNKFGITIYINSDGVGYLTNNIIGLVYIGLIGPILEELTFRGIVLNRLKKYGIKFSIITSAVIFSIVHANLGQLLQAFFMGLFLGYIFVKTNSLFLPIILHAMINSFTIMSGKVFTIININSEFLVYSLIFIIFFIGTIHILYSSKGNISLGKDLTLIEDKSVKESEDRVDNINSNNEFSRNIYISFYSTIPIVLMLIIYAYLLMASVQVL